jgi:hypothetical protein
MRVFTQSSTPSGAQAGDVWINEPNYVAVCVNTTSQVWQALTPSTQDASTFHPYIGVLTDTCTRASFTDGGSTSGTRVMAGVIPVGAVLLGSKVIVNLGFTGDTSAALIIGDGSDTDRYNTSTVDVFTTAATGVQSGIPSGNKLITTANSPTLTITSNADFTNVAAGSVTVSIYYLATV